MKSELGSFERLNRYEQKYGLHRTKLYTCPILKSVATRGYVVIPNYWSECQCDNAVNQIDNLLAADKHHIWRDRLGADKRIFGSNHISSSLDLFSDNRIENWIQQLFGDVNLSGFSMASRLDNISGNLGSGQGWHRDSCVTYQFKAILYLTDVTHANGPFQYRPSSHTIEDILYLEEYAGIGIDTNRLDGFSSFFNNEKIDEITGKRGTLILVDTRGVHRGKPMAEGKRYSLTNYYWNHGIPEHIHPFVNQ